MGNSDLITKCKQILIYSMKYFKTRCTEQCNFLIYKKHICLPSTLQLVGMCVLPVHQKEREKCWGARYLSKNTLISISVTLT
jgi:hypothetical protein